MKQLLAIVVLALSLTGCAAFQKALPYIPSPDQLACAEVEIDARTPALLILTKCGFASDALGFLEAMIVGRRKADRMRMARVLDGVQHVDAGGSDL